MTPDSTSAQRASDRAARQRTRQAYATHRPLRVDRSTVRHTHEAVYSRAMVHRWEPRA